jgi:two-component system chemotaxis response regulator CheB
VDDSPVALALLKRILASAPDMKVVGWAGSGDRALVEIEQLRPDVICTDLHMPRMNGLELTRAVMAKMPRPILAISASVQAEEDRANIFALLEAGAVDVFPKPQSGLQEDYEAIQQQLLERIRILAGVKVFGRRGAGAIAEAPTQDRKAGADNSNSQGTRLGNAPFAIAEPVAQGGAVGPGAGVVVLGASTGGPQALQTILSQLPATFPLPILCVQHISEGFLTGLTVWLRSHCALAVEVAQAGQRPLAGRVYFAPEQRHLELDGRGYFRMTTTPPVAGHRPAVTVTFESIARCYGRRAVGVLLTGMGSDGAAGMVAIAKAGGVTLAQDEATSVVFGMPGAAIALGVVQRVLPLEAIAPALQTTCLSLARR